MRDFPILILRTAHFRPRAMWRLTHRHVSWLRRNQGYGYVRLYLVVDAPFQIMCAFVLLMLSIVDPLFVVRLGLLPLAVVLFTMFQFCTPFGVPILKYYLQYPVAIFAAFFAALSASTTSVVRRYHELQRDAERPSATLLIFGLLWGYPGLDAIDQIRDIYQPRIAQYRDNGQWTACYVERMRYARAIARTAWEALKFDF